MSFPVPTTTTKTADLKAQLAQIGLLALAECAEDFLARATKGRWSPRQIVEEIVRLEQTEGAKRSLQRRLARSRIGRFKPMADFDWNWPKKIERDVIERALTLDFLEDGRNFVLLGANGLGKSMIAKNLAYQAVLAGYSVLFVTAAEMIDQLRTEVAQSTFRRKLTRYASPQLLVIDEVGYLAYDHHAADLLYKVVDRRYEKKSIVLTTNLGFRNWNTVFPNATSIATLLDKLTHHADVTAIEGESYRVHESQKEAAARRKKK
jgi:DNA replication protein DnaC